VTSLRSRLGSDLDGAFAELVAEFEGAVFTTALRVSDRPDQAEDLAAETFMHAFAALRHYPLERIETLQLRPWLITICLNLWRNQIRAAGRRPAVASAPVSMEPAQDPPATGESPEERALRHDEGDRLAALLQRIPEKQRIAVVLRHIVGLSYTEVAEVLACPEGTAKSHVSRGLDQLRTLSDAVPEVHP
jgi:RNA polymerase sigma-70 factor (ECF subfamily)